MQFFLFFCVILFALSTEVLSHHSARRVNTTLLTRHHSKRQNGPNGFGGFGPNRGNKGNNNNGISAFCQQSKKPPGDGTQIRGGACISTSLGETPDVSKMTSTIINFPPNGGQMKANKPFNVVMTIANIQTGLFSDPQKQYYVESQTLNAAGVIEGHTHVTIQQINGQQPNNPPDASVFAFFKGADDPADAQGKITIPVDKGLPAGDYRVCTMASSFTHQSVIMPVAQRGAQDDCIRMKVVN